MKTATAKLGTILVLAFLGAALTASHAVEAFPDKYDGKWEAAGPNVRIMRHQDGSRTEFRRSPDDKTLTKKTTGTNGYIKMTAVYKMDANANPLACKIFDGQGNILYKVSYGYHKKTGQLVAENMFDARAKFLDPSGKPLPVRTLYYTYDAQGNRSKALSISPMAGKTAEEVYGNRSTHLHTNPFKNE